jgi:membrane fusion protein, heavy metal efflux system
MMKAISSQWLRTLLVAVSLVAAGVLAGASGSRSQQEPSPTGQEADEGHDSEVESDPVVDLPPAALESIGLTTQVVSLGPVESTLRFPGTVRMHPDGVAILSTRIRGKILSANVAPGDRVKRGQILARIQSLVPGNPPPIIELTAPIAGVVARRDATVGEAVQPDKDLFRLIDPRMVVAEARVPERTVERIRLGQRARFRRLRDDRWWSGRVTFIGSEVDPDTRTYPAWITLDENGPPPPHSGQFGEILVIESSRSAITVPLAAVVEDGPLRFVFVQEDHGLERRLVRLGVEDARNAEVISGLSPGETVAVVGSYELFLALQSGGPGAADAESVPHGH